MRPAKTRTDASAACSADWSGRESGCLSVGIPKAKTGGGAELADGAVTRRGGVPRDGVGHECRVAARLSAAPLVGRRRRALLPARAGLRDAERDRCPRRGDPVLTATSTSAEVNGAAPCWAAFASCRSRTVDLHARVDSAGAGVTGNRSGSRLPHRIPTPSGNCARSPAPPANSPTSSSPWSSHRPSSRSRGS